MLASTVHNPHATGFVLAQTASFPGKEVHRVRGWRWLLVRLVAVLIRLWVRTLRFRYEGLSPAQIAALEGPALHLIWHNRLFPVGPLFARYRPGRTFCTLISPSRDGAWLVGLFEALGIAAVRGSSNERGREGLRGLLQAVRSGHDLGITPDGPKGPCYVLKPGAAAVARLTGLPVCFHSFEYARYWELSSWDGFRIPWPFTRVTARCSGGVPLSAMNIPADTDPAVFLQAQMEALRLGTEAPGHGNTAPPAAEEKTDPTEAS